MSLFYSNPPGRRAGVFTFHMSSLMPWIDWIIYTLADFLTATFAAFPPTTFGRFCSSFLYEFWLFLWYLMGSTSGRNPAKKSVPLIDLTPRQAKYSNVCVIRCKKKFLIIQVFSAFCLTFAHACVQYCVSPLIYTVIWRTISSISYTLHSTQPIHFAQEFRLTLIQQILCGFWICRYICTGVSSYTAESFKPTQSHK